MRLFAIIVACMTFSAGSAFAEGGDLFERVDHHYADSDGVKIHYVTFGRGEPVLFVHGFPDFWYTWRKQIEGLSSDFKCIAMDTRAYNKSDKPEGVENYEMEFLMADVTAVIDDLGYEDVTLVGHDWGGVIAWSYAMQNPERVNKLVILNLTHPRGYLTVKANATPAQKAATNYIKEFQKPDAAKLFSAPMMAGFVAGPDKVVHERYIEAFSNSYIDGMLNYYRASYDRLSGEAEIELPSLAMPVLQFHGLKDTAVDKDGLRDTWNWIDSDYTLVTVPSSSHWVQRDASDIVTTTMRWWLLSRP